VYASHDQPHRAHRSAVSPEAAAAELRRPAARGATVLFALKHHLAGNPPS